MQHQIESNPHLLFMLNKQGMTPLDVAINEKEEEKAKILIESMQRFSPSCSLKFVKRPHRLDLRFEKAFALAVLRNNSALVQSFPEKSVKTVVVSMGQVKDYRRYKDEKAGDCELRTSPLHLACRFSNEEAVRRLVEAQQADVNLLLNDRSALYELLCTAGYLDFNILTYLLKKRRPCVNSGTRLPLNQAILRGNPFIIKTLVDYGHPNLFVRDWNGKTAMHVAAGKLDLDTFDLLFKEGADPMLSDAEGNTILHLMALGVVRDAEYDFVKQIVEKYGMRLTRNSENKTPLNIIRSCSGKPVALRGQPNYKKKLWEYFERKIAEDPGFQDADGNAPVHEAVIRGSLEELRRVLDAHDLKDGKSGARLYQVLELRNYEGKSALMLAVEHEREAVTKFIMAEFPNLDLEKQDVKDGNSVLHIACVKEDPQIVQFIFDRRPKLCLKQNYLGQTPIHLATQRKNLQILKIFEEYKQDCLLIKDINGENPLFYAAREGDAEIFKWFQGHIDFFKARGEQNYKGQTIEHVVCIAKKLAIVDAIRPRPDTKDFYGNLPVMYSVMQDDVEILQKHFRKGRDYFGLRNYRHETVFHVAAKFNALRSLQVLTGRAVFIEELVRKDYKGDTPMHVAAKKGNVEILEFLMSNCTRSFMEIQNDFGLTVADAVAEKIRLLEEQDGEATMHEDISGGEQTL